MQGRSVQSALVSVVVPVFNGGAWVHAAIESVLQQTYGNLEVIAVNDGSTDESLAVLQSFYDQRLRIVNQANAGQSAAINRGVTESRGRWVKLLDADDWINPGHIAAQVQSLAAHDGCISCCAWGDFRSDFRLPAVREEHTDRDYSDPLEWISDSLRLDEGMMGGWRWLIPREVWDRSGGYDERLSLNNDFHASIAILLASSGVRFAPGAIYSYRRGLSGSLSGVVSRKAMESALLTTELGCRLLLEREDSARIRGLCAVRFQRWAYDFFPQFPDLAAAAEDWVAQLGGAEVAFPGGIVGTSLSRVIGWKVVRRLQQMAAGLGLNSLRRLKRRLRDCRLR